MLSTGEVEVLLTTLLDTRRFKHGYFSEIYCKRWGIETCFHVIKSFLELANFSAYTVNNCWQDVYSHFINYNIQTALFMAKEREIKKVNKQRQHDYKPNGRSCNLSPYRAKFWITVSHLLESRAARRKYSFSTAGLSQNAEVFLKRKLIIRRTPDSMIPLPHIKLPAL
ncbi:MAG: transposase [Lewinellaceae bacterium]|nr:transposase [Lewinellaceae bacterium]